MVVGILGTKLGMTQVFEAETGKAIPVTVVEAGPCVVTQIKTEQTDGYTAVQIGYGEAKNKTRQLNTKEPKEVNKYLTNAQEGHLVKSGGTPLRYLREYRVDNTVNFELGQQIKVDLFEAGQLVDVTGKSIGKGFAGYQKRHNFRRGPMAHGSKNHRLPGSTGPGTTPGRVYPGKKMAGHLGNVQVTTRKLKIVRIDAERNLLLIKGSIPGKSGTLISIAPANIVGQK
ncbi:MAG: 50S ribosomal protein L3 [Trichodesmium sp. St16_bin4-tuft]|nr:50S ribosomal protein L3 [Trichodesmium sp. MAG_R01]MDE5069148.1 50S ribosomal protein L3 [Trichodesmium sp. St4_bin8_1]MDE5071488.1 50S ribosomal protein L3 [Trichodesmium sp. St5_bin8]MDE5078483.1 50S ribosomal protein L3 [Trichodesmium sp. St2_bin6]MDE5090490.1 50S ribosomal protein L3 [Trichodesmium sp. St18_bin3_1_1]MDE5098771.1 50S ribosomal protein L3 [Trichodesmium sp. St16_bin4-tuft]MDE5102503.1 50S ribosomal protein L3 [Trichodesmium sp. St19_bin2]